MRGYAESFLGRANKSWSGNETVVKEVTLICGIYPSNWKINTVCSIYPYWRYHDIVWDNQIQNYSFEDFLLRHILLKMQWHIPAVWASEWVWDVAKFQMVICNSFAIVLQFPLFVIVVQLSKFIEVWNVFYFLVEEVILW